MRKSTILAALLALSFAPQASAQDWTAVPHELVMTAPASELTNQGAILWRLVHAEIRPGQEFTDIRIRFVASSPGPVTPCEDSATECFPNALGRLNFRLRNQPTGTPADATADITIGGAATIDKAQFDLAYMAELVALFTGRNLTISARDGTWTIASDEGFSETQWQPMSLRDASHAVAFAANFDLPPTQTGDCVIRQIIAARDDQSTEARAVRANIDEIAANWLLDTARRDNAATLIRLRHVALGLLAREDEIPQTAADALKIEGFANLIQKHGEGFLTQDYEQLRLAAEYEKRVMAAKLRLDGLTPAYICENLVAP